MGERPLIERDLAAEYREDIAPLIEALRKHMEVEDAALLAMLPKPEDEA